MEAGFLAHGPSRKIRVGAPYVASLAFTEVHPTSARQLEAKDMMP